MIYLASPYSHSDPLVRQARFDAACRVTANLIQAGQAVVAPIVLGHPLVRFGVPIAQHGFVEERCRREQVAELPVPAGELAGWR